MKVIITCDPENMEAAQAVANQELADNWASRYNKPGWGWHFNKGGARFFVRGIIGGISVTQVS